MLHLYAALAEKERRLIADRTRGALQAKKAAGAALGNRTNLGLVDQRGVFLKMGSGAVANVSFPFSSPFGRPAQSPWRTSPLS